MYFYKTILFTSVMIFLSIFSNMPLASPKSEAVCVDTHCKKYVKYLKRFVKNGSNEARVILASMHLNGIGVERNIDKAIKYLERAHKAGQGQASWLLYSLYKNEKTADVDKAFLDELFAMAIKRNVNGALFQRASESIDFSKQDNYKSMQVLANTSLKNHKPSMYLLAKMYEFGEGTKQDLLKAADLYKKLELFDYKDSAVRFENILKSSVSRPSLYKQIEKLDIEVISVRGQKLGFTANLGIFIKKLQESGLYDGKGGFTRIRGKNCTHSSSACGVIYDIEGFMSGTM